MDRSATSAPEHPTAVRTAGPAALDLLLPAAAGERGEPAPAAAARRAVPGVPVLRQPAHGGHVGGQSQAHPAADAHSGHRGPVSETQFEPPGAGPRDLPVLTARSLHRAAQPGLEHRYYLRSDAGRLPLPGGRHGLVQPLRAQLGTLQYHGDRLLPGRAGQRASASASPRSGTPIRVPSSPPPIFWRRSKSAASRSAWMGAAALWTMSSSSACGAL